MAPEGREALRPRRAVVAVGGNAITSAEAVVGVEWARLEAGLRGVAALQRRGVGVVVTHGNGPQVGDALARVEAARDQAPLLSLALCGAETQGLLGAVLERGIREAGKAVGIELDAAVLVTHVLVDRDDPAFEVPTKCVGRFYTAGELADLEARGWVVREVEPERWRRVVPSPRPREVLGLNAVRQLVASGLVVVAAGGGGIPVVRGEGDTLEWVEAVIDKDLTASCLARKIGADLLITLTDVDGVYLGYGTDEARLIEEMTCSDARGWLEAGEFPPGSMGPKVEGVVEFVEATQGLARIGRLEAAEAVIEGQAGTTFRP